MTAGRVVLVAVAVLTASVAGAAGGTADRALLPGDLAGETATATTHSTTPGPRTPGNNSSATAANEPGSSDENGSTAFTPNEAAAAVSTDLPPIRRLSGGSVRGRTGSGVVVVDEHGRVLLRAFVVLTCTTLAVSATPAGRPYSLSMVFVDEDSGRRLEFHAGPLNGTVTDPFGRTPLTLVRVDLRFLGRVVLSRDIPEWCGWPTAAAA